MEAGVVVVQGASAPLVVEGDSAGEDTSVETEGPATAEEGIGSEATVDSVQGAEVAGSGVPPGISDVAGAATSVVEGAATAEDSGMGTTVLWEG
jgi:hypothetical protein